MTPAKPSILATLFSSRMFVQLMMGFSSGLPLLLTGSTLQAWMVEAKVDLRAIGLFTLVGLPYTLKFFWSPLFDRYVPPLLGRRRGWILVVQVALTAAIFSLGQSEPAASPLLVAVLALGVTFMSASQDIVLDAYRRETLADSELGLGSSLFVAAYRVAMLVSGALALFLADHLEWRTVYALMSCFMVIGIITTLLCAEPTVDGPPPRTLRDAVVGPFIDFFRRDGAWWILAFILLYKLGDNLAVSMTTPMILELGFSKTELAGAVKVFGMGALIGGTIFGGILMVKLGIGRALWVFGVMQAAGILLYAALAATGKVWWLLGLAVGGENLAMGMGSSAYLAYMASQTNRRFTATQYALFTSLMGAPRVLFSAPTGYLARAVGWPMFFVCCTVAAIPGMLLLLRIAPKEQPIQ